MYVCMQEATDAVLDALIEEVPQANKTIKVYYSLLEADANGDVYSGSKRTNFNFIVNTENKVRLYNMISLTSYM